MISYIIAKLKKSWNHEKVSSIWTFMSAVICLSVRLSVRYADPLIFCARISPLQHGILLVLYVFIGWFGVAILLFEKQQYSIACKYNIQYFETYHAPKSHIGDTHYIVYSIKTETPLILMFQSMYNVSQVNHSHG